MSGSAAVIGGHPAETLNLKRSKGKRLLLRSPIKICFSAPPKRGAEAAVDAAVEEDGLSPVTTVDCCSTVDYLRQQLRQSIKAS